MGIELGAKQPTRLCHQRVKSLQLIHMRVARELFDCLDDSNSTINFIKHSQCIFNGPITQQAIQTLDIFLAQS